MPKTSAGLLLYRRPAREIEVLLAHPGGPYWRKRDLGAWSLPKGETRAGEDPLVTARREFHEETGFAAEGDAIPLGQTRQAGGKLVHAWAVEGDADPGALESDTFEIEWPPRSGRRERFPEVDRAAWFDIPEARRRIVAGQTVFLDRLVEQLGKSRPRRR